jgi:hypothetical protein
MGHISCCLYADDINLLCENINTIKEVKQAQLYASKEVALLLITTRSPGEKEVTYFLPARGKPPITVAARSKA